jgi:hypothetical protein
LSTSSASGGAALAAALDYLARGFSAIPLRPGDKRPLLAWAEFQTRQANADEARRWWRRWPAAGVGIVTGAISRLVVLDFDPRNGEALAQLAPRLPTSPGVTTGGGGAHVYYRLPAGAYVDKVPALLAGLDVQADGAYVVAPPSVHPTGRRYQWTAGRGLEDVPLAPLPPVVRALLALYHAHETPPARRRVAGTLKLEAVLEHLAPVRRSGQGWMARCPPHDDEEASLSIARGEGGRVLLHCFAGCSYSAIVRALRNGSAA